MNRDNIQSSTPESSAPPVKPDMKVFTISLLTFVAVILLGIINLKWLAAVLDAGQLFISNNFNWFYASLVSITLFYLVGLMFTRSAKLKVGNIPKPEFSTFMWGAIYFCTAIAAGSTFWATAEPISHLASVPPGFPGTAAGTPETAVKAMTYAWFHWGPHAWIIYSLFAIAIGYAHYHKGLPMRPSSALYPLIGEKGVTGALGKAVDIFSIVAVVSGIVAAIGFLTTQFSASLNISFGVPKTTFLQFLLLAIIVATYTISCVTGVFKGISWLSAVNAYWAIFLAILLFLVGPTLYIMDLASTSLGFYLNNVFWLSFWSEPILKHSGWLNWWTVFYWAWWIGWGPCVGMFLARISKGRSVRGIIGVSLASAGLMCAWFAIIGGTAIHTDLTNQGAISAALKTQGMEAALFTVIQYLPLKWVFQIGFLFVMLIFLITSCDSISLAVGMTITGTDEPPAYMRIAWALTMGVFVAILILIGQKGVSIFMTAAIITGLPVAVIMAAVLFALPPSLKGLSMEQAPMLSPAGTPAAHLGRDR